MNARGQRTATRAAAASCQAMPAPRPAAMRRALLAAAAALPLAAWPAQPPARIAWISPINAASSADYLAAFRQRMRENGLVEGRHYRLDIHYADGHYDRFPALLGVALAGAPSVIVVITVASVIAAQRATQTVPIVFVSTNDPLGSGLVTSLSRPDGNTTGISNQNEDLIRSPWSRSQSRDPARNAKSSHRRRAPDLLVEHAANQRTGRQEDRPSAVTGSGRKVASRGQRQLHSFTVGGIGKAGLYILGRKIGKIAEQLLRGHPGGEVLEHLVHRDAQAANARLAAPLARLDGNEVAIVQWQPPQSFARALSLGVHWRGTSDRVITQRQLSRCCCAPAR